MSNRVLLGLRSGDYGLWVSKPGVDVLTAGDDQLMLSSTRRSAQVVVSGVIAAGTNGSYNISWPDLGFTPVILLGSARFGGARVTHTSSTTATINAGVPQTFAFWSFTTIPNPAYAISYAVLNIPV